MQHLIVGFGEVGRALYGIFSDASTIDLTDTQRYGINSVPRPFGPNTPFTMHICFPYNEKFVTDVATYQERLKPAITIIHSSVPVGTSDKLDAVYSPVRGVHPNLEQGIRTFVKYFGGFKANEAAALFREQGISTRVVANARTLEAAKLWDTTVYGLQILIEKEIWDWCQANAVDYEIVYREFTDTYNAGYRELGMPHVVRPWLMHKDGKIGGHCVLQNAALLDSPSARRLIKENETL